MRLLELLHENGLSRQHTEATALVCVWADWILGRRVRREVADAAVQTPVLKAIEQGSAVPVATQVGIDVPRLDVCMRFIRSWMDGSFDKTDSTTVRVDKKEADLIGRGENPVDVGPQRVRSCVRPEGMAQRDPGIHVLTLQFSNLHVSMLQSSGLGARLVRVVCCRLFGICYLLIETKNLLPPVARVSIEYPAC